VFRAENNEVDDANYDVIDDEEADSNLNHDQTNPVYLVIADDPEYRPDNQLHPNINTSLSDFDGSSD